MKRARRRPLIVAAAMVCAVPGGATARPNVDLRPISSADWRAADVGGTGCWWRPEDDRRWRLAMSGRSAVARVGGRLTFLVPDQGARVLFPFTYDAWRGRGVVMRVVAGRMARRSGVEVMEVPARLIVSGPRGRSVLRGILSCGS